MDSTSLDNVPHHQFQRAIPPYARKAFGGKRRMRKRFASRSAGEIWLQKIESRLKALKEGGDLASVGVQRTETFKRASAGWFDQLEVQPSTREWYRLYLKKRLVPAFGALRLTAIDKAELTAYRVRRRNEKTKTGKRTGARTIQAELAVISRVLRWAKSEGFAIDESAFAAEPPKSKPVKMRRYDPDMVERLLAAARRGPKASTEKYGRKTPAALARVAAQDVAVIETFQRTGMRAGELRAFAVSWIRWDDRRIVVPHDLTYSPKGGKSRSIPLEAPLAVLLRRHLGEREDGRVFEPARPGYRRGDGHYRGTGIDVQKLIDRVAEAAGVDLTAHDLRHHAISRWVELMSAGGYSLADVQEWAGHASIRTTELYLHTAGGRWRARTDGLDRAVRDSGLDSSAPTGHLQVIHGTALGAEAGNRNRTGDSLLGKQAGRSSRRR